MKTFTTISSLLALTSLCVATHVPVFVPVELRGDDVLNATAMDELFVAWQRVHDRQYASAEEAAMRRAVFVQHAAMVAAHNRRPDASFTMELNQFADLTWAEIQSQYLSAQQDCSATHLSTAEVHYGNAPDEKDWRRDGVLTRVKSQGVCGSCWAFSATGCLESHHAIKHGRQVLLSEQNLIDCAQGFDNHGCHGGLPSQAFEYVRYNGGIDTEASYRYKARDQSCRFEAGNVGARVESVVNITSRNEDELTAAVGTVGPVSIALQVMLDFMFYKSGVYESTKCHQDDQHVDHAVLAVGYGTTEGSDGDAVPYWIVKNSWSDKWGIDGYFLIKRGVNMCGLADCASYAVVA